MEHWERFDEKLQMKHAVSVRRRKSSSENDSTNDNDENKRRRRAPEKKEKGSKNPKSRRQRSPSSSDDNSDAAAEFVSIHRRQQIKPRTYDGTTSLETFWAILNVAPNITGGKIPTSWSTSRQH